MKKSKFLLFGFVAALLCSFSMTVSAVADGEEIKCDPDDQSSCHTVITENVVYAFKGKKQVVKEETVE